MLLLCNIARAEEPSPYRHHGFEIDRTIAQPATQLLNSALKSHAVTAEDFHSGSKCERMIFQSEQVTSDGERVVIALPRAKVISELRASVWIRSSCQNVRLGVRVCFPYQIDPRTNEPLQMELFGESYKQIGKWQQVSCQTSEEAMQSRLLRLRNQISDGIRSQDIDTRDFYVDQLTIALQLPQGISTLQLDDLEFGPIVELKLPIPEKGAASGMPSGSQLAIADDRIRKNGAPFFPIFTLYHGESLDLIAQTGVNMLWVKDYEDRPLLEALAGMNIGGIASPPQPTPESAILKSAGIPSIPEWTSPIWAWMLGIKIPAEDRKYISGWAEQIRDADRQIRRPVLADVSSEEREFHRHVDFLASSRFAIHTAVSSPNHFAELRGRRDYALPGKPMFTFLQTEASEPLLNYFESRNLIPIVEPEQILHQGYEAIAAGFKGVGFWKQIPFDSQADGLDERLDALRIFCLHCRALEPYLATGRIVDEIAVQVGRNPAAPVTSSPLSSKWDRIVSANGAVSSAEGAAAEIRATVFHTERGLLILLVWHEPGSQCVPGAQSATSVRVLIRGVDAAQAWEVTPTGAGQSNLDMDRVAGGTEITLRHFDQFTAIVVPNGSAGVKQLQEVTRQNRKLAAEAFVNLANAKLKRVTEVHQSLSQVGAPQLRDGDAALARAATAIEQARQELHTDRVDDARILSQSAMRQLRVIQRAYWESAIKTMTSPTSTLEATSFQTLPEHWRLMSALGRVQNLGENKLPSGNFEDESALLAGGDSETGTSWTDGSKGSRWTSLRLEHGGGTSGNHLTLIVKPDSPAGQSAVVISPKADVSEGDLVVMTGKYRIPYALAGTGHQFSIFETLTGRDGALIVKEKSEGWQSFRMIRRAHKDGALRMRFELTGPGLVNLDEIQVHVVPKQEVAAQ